MNAAAAIWRERFRAGLAAAGPTRSDDSEALPTGSAIAAAVLVPVVLHPEPSILLTRRTETLRRHAGQVSFPGGRIEPGDTDPTRAALRETFEELGLVPESISLVGQLPQHLTGTGFVITPVVGLVHPPLSLAPDPNEVADIFELPLAVVLDETQPRQREAEFAGRIRRFWEYPQPRHHIWGATAAILVNLGRVLRGGV
jgi:8-oxo-dGTP pyrophosphatase MutT (NUDIX family)